MRIDFCEADVLDTFDEWRRATGVTAAGEDRSAGGDRQAGHRGPSLPVHMERVLRRLTSARAAGTLDAGFDDLLDRVSREMDVAGGVQGRNGRRSSNDWLRSIVSCSTRYVPALTTAHALALTREAEEELAGFRSGMSPEAFARAREAAVGRLLRERAGLPTIAFQ